MDYVRTDISEPLEEPVSLDEAKSWCRVDHHHEDDLIEGLRLAGTNQGCINFCENLKITPFTNFIGGVRAK